MTTGLDSLAGLVDGLWHRLELSERSPVGELARTDSSLEMVQHRLVLANAVLVRISQVHLPNHIYGVITA